MCGNIRVQSMPARLVHLPDMVGAHQLDPMSTYKTTQSSSTSSTHGRSLSDGSGSIDANLHPKLSSLMSRTTLCQSTTHLMYHIHRHIHEHLKTSLPLANTSPTTQSLRVHAFRIGGRGSGSVSFRSPHLLGGHTDGRS